MPADQIPYTRKKRGFQSASRLLQPQIRKAGEARGFAVTRLLTHWAEIVGERTAAMTRPVKVNYGRDGFGATLTVLTTGASAPILEMEKPKILERVNACYGYRAISHIRVTQTAPVGFADGRADFDHAPKKPAATQPDSATKARAKDDAGDVQNADLRAALEALGANVYAKSSQKGT